MEEIRGRKEESTERRVARECACVMTRSLPKRDCRCYRKLITVARDVFAPGK